MNSSIKLIIAIAAGATIGGLLGVLFAPEKGSITRKKIVEQGKELTDDFKELLKQENLPFIGKKEVVPGMNQPVDQVVEAF
ncbi:MAG: YtxH domain-containing protein [Candidatus Dadabacteria bacterium]